MSQSSAGYSDSSAVPGAQVGSTTAAIVLSHVAREQGYNVTCEGGASTACVEHTALSHMKNT